MKKIIKRILVCVGIIIFFIIFFATKYMYGIYCEGVNFEEIKNSNLPHIYDINKNEIATIYNKKVIEYIDIDDIPVYVEQSFISIEDKRFYEHNGFDLKRTIGATFNYFKNNIIKENSIGYGGSTITQQLVRNITLDDKDTIGRKMREIARAIYLEKHLSKDEILEAYINYVYYGEGAYGIGSASKTFFGKEVKDLTIAQSAVLAAMLKSPEGNNPYLSKENINRLIKRQKVVLSQMYKEGYINTDEYNKAVDEKIEFSKFYDTPIDQYIRLVIKEAKDTLGDDIYGDVKIYTNIDMDYQRKAYDILKSYFNDDVEVSFVLTSKDGNILSAISSRNNSKFDRVIDMKRQPGSVIKPLAIYGPAFDLGLITPNSTVTDEYISIGSWVPRNVYKGYRGNMSVYSAVGNSVNVIAIKMLQEIGITKSVDYLEKFGITSIEDSDYVYPLAIGGMTYGISPYEMVSAYNTFNNDGNYIKSTFINKITVDGKEKYVDKETKKVISSEANNMVLDVLEYTVKYGTAKSAKVNGKNVYAKTGTTNDKKDYWLCGLTDDITAVIWVGYDDPKTMNFKSTEVIKLWSKLVTEYYK